MYARKLVVPARGAHYHAFAGLNASRHIFEYGLWGGEVDDDVDTAKSVGISGEPTLVRPEQNRKTLLDLLLGDVSQYIPTREKMMEQEVGFYYLWK